MMTGPSELKARAKAFLYSLRLAAGKTGTPKKLFADV
jgi:hypothetical protein